MSHWSPAVEKVGNRVNAEIAQALHDGIADPTVRDFAAAMVALGYELGESDARLRATLERIPRREPEPVNTAAEPDPRSAEPYQTLVAETTEPYISVNVSVTSDDAESLLKVAHLLVRAVQQRLYKPEG